MNAMNVLLRAVLPFAFALTVAGQALAQDELPQTSEEGLEVVARTDSTLLYRRPGTTFADYDELILLDAFVSIDEDWLRNYNRQVMRTRRLRDKDVKEITERIRLGFWEVFGGDLFADGSYKEVPAAKEGVLILRPAIIDVSVNAHNVSGDAMVQNFDSDTNGSMTLIMEIYNAANSELVGRLYSKESIGGVPDFAMESESSNRADEEAVYKRWAVTVKEQLQGN